MQTISMNSENCKISDLHSLLLNLTDKTSLKKSDKYVALSKLSIFIHANYKKNHTKIINLKSVTTWKEKFELPDGSYSVSDIKDYV